MGRGTTRAGRGTLGTETVRTGMRKLEGEGSGDMGNKDGDTVRERVTSGAGLLQ